MDTYRIINKELSINNQELRNVINKLKHEVTYLNRQLLEQREEFNRLKASIGKTIEQKYAETMALIFPDKLPDEKKNSKLDIKSHRRSCSNVTAADPIKNRSYSPPAAAAVAAASSSGSDIMEESPFKMPIPRIVIEKSARLSKSPGKCPQSISVNQSQLRKSADSTTSKNCTEDLDDSDCSSLDPTLITTNTSLVTINEEKSGTVDPQNETLSDATINCLLEAPCSTPYNQNKILIDTIFQPKKVRVLIKKMNEGQLASLSSCQSIVQNSPLQVSSVTLKQKSFKTKSVQIEACHAEKKSSQINSSHFTTTNNASLEYKIDTTSDKESSSDWKHAPKKTQTKVGRIPSRDKSIKRRKSIKVKANKENRDTDSDFTCSDEESGIGRRRLRNKQISLKEPNLRAKLRNTTNMKL